MRSTRLFRVDGSDSRYWRDWLSARLGFASVPIALGRIKISLLVQLCGKWEVEGASLALFFS
jgi:hypothetical protein